jgi:hypothetical protein
LERREGSFINDVETVKWENEVIDDPMSDVDTRHAGPFGPFFVGDQVAIGRFYHPVGSNSQGAYFQLWDQDWERKVKEDEKWVGFPYVAFSPLIARHTGFLMQLMTRAARKKARYGPKAGPLYLLPPEDEEAIEAALGRE